MEVRSVQRSSGIIQCNKHDRVEIENTVSIIVVAHLYYDFLIRLVNVYICKSVSYLLK